MTHTKKWREFGGDKISLEGLVFSKSLIGLFEIIIFFYNFTIIHANTNVKQ
jgi:hypothetical protein